MTTEATIEKFDVNAAAEKLKLQIRSAFIELLTPEQFRDMVQAELKQFTEETTRRDNYNSQAVTTPSGFSKLCRSVFEEHVKAELKALLASPEYSAGWGHNGRQLISEAVKSWLTENRQALIETTVLTFAGNAAQQLLESLRHR